MKYHGFVELLTPICKAWPSDMGFRVTEWAMQCFGGYGYCSDYPVEQYMRDIKITSIYEGTNGIQAMDLLGRKISMKGGMLFMNFLAMLGEFIEKNKSHATLGGEYRPPGEGQGHPGSGDRELREDGSQWRHGLPLASRLSLSGDVRGCDGGLSAAGSGRDRPGEASTPSAREKGADSEEAKKSLCQEDDEAKFYWGKLCSADFFATQILPRVQCTGRVDRERKPKRHGGGVLTAAPRKIVLDRPVAARAPAYAVSPNELSQP